ncbi:MAG: DUF3800 domain-containing protein [Coriobacteriia bacterium]
MARDDCTYMYFDEAGNFDFSSNGTAIFCMTCVVMKRPFSIQSPLLEVKYDALENGLNLEYFHATEDKQRVRDRVFEAIASRRDELDAYSVIIRKNMTNPTLRDPAILYRRTFEWLVKFACPRTIGCGSHVVAVTDQIPVHRHRSAVAKALKPYFKSHLPAGVTYDLFHHQSKSDLNLQIADYISWAVYKKWNNQDLRSYSLVQPCIRGEGDLFKDGDRVYY